MVLNGGKSATVRIVVMVVELLVRGLWSTRAMSGGEIILSNISSHNKVVIYFDKGFKFN